MARGRGVGVRGMLHLSLGDPKATTLKVNGDN
eukprot:CAMPEP_0185774202 /NCGR_PEP_ID=MMETSP1174-20130828/77135_1 /TAXON_ID=35687 /ORGANISM="Dictyocha speculum, Strain CCMP1381" /LENGTH=31 /DNA_ID= /DNA_START= /DNA_END= /DNA_ORIENTATION=